MNKPLEQAALEALSSPHPAAEETWDLTQTELTPHTAARVWLQASLRLTRAQKDLHDAIFGLDGTDESLDRFASARSELDSAEAWALCVAKSAPRPS